LYQDVKHSLELVQSNERLAKSIATPQTKEGHQLAESLKVIEAFRNLFYSPLYVALALGSFRSEGLELSVTTRQPGQDILSMLRSGEADVALTGPMRCFVAADRGESNIPLSFIEVNSREGFMLLARRQVDRFSWSDLNGHTVLTYREPPTPWMCLLSVLSEQGVDPINVDISTQRPVVEALAAFREGYGDYIELPEPFAEDLISQGLAHLATPMGAWAGAIPYSSFAATPDFLVAKRDVSLRFTRAFYSAQRQLEKLSSAEVARLVSPYLPGRAAEILIPGIERYQAHGTWARDPLLRPKGFHRLQRILIDGHLISTAASYRQLVQPDLANEAMQGLTHVQTLI
jgi:NitT/TauT family transport system substrate-binding protein